MTTVPHDIRVLFIGNSYTSRNQLPQRIVELAASAPQPRKLHVHLIFAGGASLRRHWNAGLAREAIQTGGWDYVVLQEQSTLPVKNAQRYHDNVRLFAAEIAAQRARIVLYLTWSRQTAPQTQELITRAVSEIAAETGALVVPVGVAWQAALAALPEVALYEADGSHPTAAGSYLAACSFYLALLGEPVAGDAAADALKLDHTTARRLEEIAGQTRLAA
jgi:hypothetical protein